MAAQSFEYFFDLPPELREQILSHVCIFPTGILVGGGVDGKSVPLAVPARSSSTAGTHASTGATNQPFHGRDEEDDEDDESEGADPPINLFLASPILYREAGDLYYGRNDFHLDLASASWGRRQQSRVLESSSSSSSTTGTGTAGNGTGIATLVRLLTHADTAPARRRIRSVVVYVKRFGALVLDVLVPALGDMVLNGCLKRMRVDVLELARGPVAAAAGLPVRLGGETRLRTADYAGNPALRALLVLLTDPDMERAELRVPRGGHAWFWCRFHQGGVSEDGGRGCQGLSGGQNREHGDGFLQVDIHRLVDACAGDAAEFKIKKVGFG